MPTLTTTSFWPKSPRAANWSAQSPMPPIAAMTGRSNFPPVALGDVMRSSRLGEVLRQVQAGLEAEMALPARLACW